MPPVVVFDFHETLVQLQPSTDALFAEVAGIPRDRCKAIFTTVEAQVEEMREAGEWPPPPEERWPRLYGLILESFRIPGRPEEIAARMSAHFADPASYVPYPEVPQALRALRVSGVRVGILSNTDLELWPLLRELGLDAHIDTAVAAFLHGVEKPDPAAFELVLDEMGVAPSATWFVGDSPRHDVLPAAAMGMSPVLVDRLDLHDDHDDYVRVRSLAELPGMVADGSARPAAE